MSNADMAELRDALDHIWRVARASRTQTRRLRWIAERARCAIEAEDWKAVDLQHPHMIIVGLSDGLVAECERLAAEPVEDLELQDVHDFLEHLLIFHHKQRDKFLAADRGPQAQAG